MENDPKEDELDAIVGAALKAMVESGAGRARLGAFAASFRDEVAQILGRKEAKPEEPDLLALVTQAVRQAIADPSMAAGARPKPLGAKRIYVLVNGRPTSVTIDRETLDGLERSVGGRKKSKAIIQELVETAPPDVSNRSGWVRDRLISFMSARGEGAARH